MYWGPAEHFHWVHQWMKVNKCGSVDKTWIGHNNLSSLKFPKVWATSHGRFLWNLGSLSHPPRFSLEWNPQLSGVASSQIHRLPPGRTQLSFWDGFLGSPRHGNKNEDVFQALSWNRNYGTFSGGLKKRWNCAFLEGNLSGRYFLGIFLEGNFFWLALFGALVFREGHGNVSTLVMMTLLV